MAADKTWPRAFSSSDGTELLVYQPQIESWREYSELEARAAFELRLQDFDQEIIGALKVTSKTETDLENRLVVLDQLQISDTRFPSLEKAAVGRAEEAVRRLFPTETVTIGLDRLLANLEREQVKVRSIDATVKPPKLLVSERDAVLVLIDGEPLLEPVEGTDLKAVINSPSDLFWYERQSQYFLRVGDGWMTSAKLEEGWAPADRLPETFNRIPDTPGWTEVREAIPGRAYAVDDAPQVFISTEPSALLVFDGKPNLSQVPGTNLLFATNTEADVFLDGGIMGNFYVLLAGRWFRTPSLQAPLEYASKDLPSDFAMIPPDHPAGRVLVAVPGTQQAQEAVLGAQIPTKVRVDRSEASVEVSYDGDPLFEAIPGTEIEYAVNTSLDVFRIKNRYYVCDDGVWFSADNPLGPWSLLDQVPAAIYTIPPTSPKYHVTHTYTYSSTEDYVETGFDGGYLGAFVVGSVLVYGITNADYVHVRACSGHCGSYYRHYHRRYRTQPVHYRNRHHHHRHAYRHQVYGHGRHYDHLSGGYARTAEVRRHQSAGTPIGATLRSGAKPSKAVARSDRVNTASGRSNVGERPAARDIYTDPNGRLYRREGEGWSRFDNGRWVDQATPPAGNVKQVAPRTHGATPRSSGGPGSLGSAVRARTDGASRPAQFNNYRQSRAPIFKRGGGGQRSGRRR